MLSSIGMRAPDFTRARIIGAGVPIPHPHRPETARRTRSQTRLVRCSRDETVGSGQAMLLSPRPTLPFPTSVIEIPLGDFAQAPPSGWASPPPGSRLARSTGTQARKFGPGCTVLASERGCSTRS